MSRNDSRSLFGSISKTKKGITSNLNTKDHKIKEAKSRHKNATLATSCLPFSGVDSSRLLKWVKKRAMREARDSSWLE